MRRLLGGAMVAWTLLVSLWRGHRQPNDWAEAHWLLDYRFGFVKRGLLGSLYAAFCSVTGTLPSEGGIQVIGWSLLGLFTAALLYILWRILAQTRWDASWLLLAALLASSPFVVFSAHLIGYFDHPALLLGIGSLVLALRGRWWGAGALQAAAVLAPTWRHPTIS